MNDQILIGILTEIKDMRTEMKTEMREIKEKLTSLENRVASLEDRVASLENRVTSLEKSRKEDVKVITDILYSFEQGISKMVTEEIEKRMCM